MHVAQVFPLGVVDMIFVIKAFFTLLDCKH